MIKLYNSIKLITCLALLFVGVGNTFGQVLKSENFNYGASVGDMTAVSSSTWSAHSGGGTGPVGYATTSLSMTDYPSSGVAGSATILKASSEDINAAFTEQTSGKVYFSGLVNISAVFTGDYFFHIKDGAFNFRGRIGAKTDGVGGINFGIGTSGNPVYGTTSYDLNTTYLLVASYDIDDANGTTNLYVLSTVLGTEPVTPEATSTGTSGTAISTVALRQGSNTPDAVIDGVRVALSWNEIMNDPPTITLDDTGFDGNFGYVIQGNSSDIRSYTIEGTNLTNDITITPPVGFQISTASDVVSDIKDNSSPLILTQTAGSVSSTIIYVRFTPDVADGSTDSGDITHVSTGATTQNVSVTGIEGVDATAPTLLSAVTATASTTNDIILEFSENVTATDASGFSVTIGGIAATINAALTGSGTEFLTITLTEEIAKTSGAILISYDASLGDAADDAANDLANFTDEAVSNNTTLNIVSDLAGVRALGSGNDVRITGEAILFYQRATRNQKYFQDATGGILVDDNAATITTVYTLGDGIVNIEGALSENGGVLQLVPSSDFGVANSTSNTLTTITLDIPTYVASFDTYESRSLKFEGIGFSTSGATFNAGDQFSTGSDSYTLTDGTNNVVFRDNISEADYSSFTIPYGRLDFAVIGAEFNGTPQLVPFTSPDAFIDNYAPLFFSAPLAGNIGTGSFDVTFQSDEPGTIYYVVDQNSTAPDIATILAGTSQAITTVKTDEVISISALTDNTQYYVHMIATDDEGTPNEQAVATTVTATTLEIVFDATSDIVVAAAPIGTQTILSTVNLLANAVDVFNFKITDDAATDTETTSITEIVISNGNATTWSSVLAGASITDGATSVEATAITDTDITFDVSGTPYVVTSAGELTFTLSVYLSASQTDQTELVFTIPTNHAIVSDVAGSVIKSTLGAAVTSSTHTIDVEATVLNIDTPSSTAPSSDFTVTITAVDANGNTDLAARIVSLSLNTGLGSLGSVTGLTSQSMTNGVFTWSDVQHDTEEAITLDVTDGVLTNTSSSINIFTATGGVFFSEYIEGSGSEKAIEIFNNTGGDIDLTTFVVELYGNADVTAGNTLNLSDFAATLANGEVIVVTNSSAILTDIVTNSDITSGVTFYNGNDALVLKQDGIIIDIIGEIGSNINHPVAGITDALSEHTLVRKSSIFEGNATPLGSFGTNSFDSEWEVLGQNITTNIGSHTVCSAPSTQASAVTFGNTDETSMVIDWTRGDGDKVLVVVKEAAAVDTAPVSGTDYSTATSVFSDAVLDLGSSNIAVFDGASTAETVTVTGLNPAVTYHVAVFEYNSTGNCFNFNSPAIGNNTTTTSTVLSVTGSLTDFGTVVNGANSASQTFTVEGTGLIDDVIITAPANFQVSSDDITYSSTANYAHTAGTLVPSTVHVRFTPGSGTNGLISDNLTVSTTGAINELVAVTGTESGNSAPLIENFDVCSDLNTWSQFSVIGDQLWGCTTFGNNSTNGVQMSGFAGSAQDNEDWLISAGLEISATSSLSFWSRTRFSGQLLNVKVSGDYTGSGDPTTATWTDLVVTLPAIDSDVWTETANVSLANFVGNDKYIAFVYFSNTTDAPRWTLDDISLGNVSYSSPFPSFVVTESLTDFGSVDNGASSASQSFTVSGADLQADVIVTAPANFEVSLDNSTFSASVDLIQASGVLASTTVHVRFAPSSGINGAVMGNIVVSTANATSQTIAVTGTEAGNTAIENDLIFSEYFEGTSNNRAFEIFNGTGADVDLSGYSVKQSHNGVGFDNDAFADAYVLPLSGTLVDGDVYVIFNVDATDATIIAEGDLPLTYGDTGGARMAAFTGDDALGLFKGGVLIDVIGDPGNDPGTAWAVAGIADATVDHTLVRKETVTTGNTTPLGSFGTNSTDSEWIVLDLDDVSSIGSHSGTTVVDPGFALTTTDFVGDFGSLAVSEVSAASSYLVSGTQITGDFTITIPTGFEASLTSDFSNKVGTSTLPLSITPTSGDINGITIFVRFAPETEGSFSGNLVNSAAGFTSVDVAVTGEATAAITGVDELAKYSIAVYPNPSNDVINIMIPDSFGKGEVKLMKLDGALVQKGAIGTFKQIQTSNLRSGIYLLQIINNETVINHRVVVK